MKWKVLEGSAPILNNSFLVEGKYCSNIATSVCVCVCVCEESGETCNEMSA